MLKKMSEKFHATPIGTKHFTFYPYQAACIRWSKNQPFTNGSYWTEIWQVGSWYQVDMNNIPFRGVNTWGTWRSGQQGEENPFKCCHMLTWWLSMKFSFVTELFNTCNLRLTSQRSLKQSEHVYSNNECLLPWEVVDRKIFLCKQIFMGKVFIN